MHLKIWLKLSKHSLHQTNQSCWIKLQKRPLRRSLNLHPTIRLFWIKSTKQVFCLWKHLSRVNLHLIKTQRRELTSISIRASLITSRLLINSKMKVVERHIKRNRSRRLNERHKSSTSWHRKALKDYSKVTNSNVSMNVVKLYCRFPAHSQVKIYGIVYETCELRIP